MAGIIAVVWLAAAGDLAKLKTDLESVDSAGSSATE